MLMRPDQMTTKKRRVELSNLDRLSSLPDELIHHIMGFLRAQEAVETCILSKRWKNMWRSLPSLIFNCLEFNCTNKFIYFVNSFLNHREHTKIDIFRVDWSFCHAESEPTITWILHALNFQPRIIYIRIRLPAFLTLPDSLFACNSLEAIDLRICPSMTIVNEIKPKPIDLLNLRRLNLGQVSLNDEFMRKLLSGSPSLEELIMKYCPVETSDITIISHSLKILIIQNCSSFYNDVAMHLSLPSLLSLHVTGVDRVDIRLKCMPSLLKACVQYNQIFHRPPKGLYELLRVLANVSHLELIGKPYNCTTESKSMGISVLKNLLEEELSACGAFVNLKILHLGDWCMSDNFDLIAHFIQLSPNLETLTLCHEKDFLRQPAEKFYLQIQFKRPEMIEIKCSVEHERVNELIHTLKAYLVTFKRFYVDISGDFSAGFWKTCVPSMVQMF